VRGKWLEQSTPKSVDIVHMAGPWHALTMRSKGHRSGSQGYTGVGMQVDTTAFFSVQLNESISS